MTYETICEQNKYLFGALETLTAQISFIKANDIDTDTSGIQKRKDAIRELISINLDKMEEIWEVQLFSYRRSRHIAEPHISYSEEPSAYELTIITAYKADPNQSQQTLADQFGTSIQTVSRIITKYLTLKFNLIPA